MAFVVSLNLHRRHLTSGQLAALAVEILPMLGVEANGRQRQQALIDQPQSQKVEMLPPSEKGKARDHTAAKEAHSQVKDVAIAERMASPTRSEMGDYTVVIGDARHLDLGQFDRCGVIVADPTWPCDNPRDHDPRMGGCTYQATTLSEIKAMPVKALAGDDAVLFLWGTWPKLPQVVEVTQSGKPVYGIGSRVAGCSEYVLIGRRGNVSPPNVDDKSLGLVGPALGHSRKPDNVHDVAETLPGPYSVSFPAPSCSTMCHTANFCWWMGW